MASATPLFYVNASNIEGAAEKVTDGEPTKSADRLPSSVNNPSSLAEIPEPPASAELGSDASPSIDNNAVVAIQSPGDELSVVEIKQVEVSGSEQISEAIANLTHTAARPAHPANDYDEVVPANDTDPVEPRVVVLEDHRRRLEDRRFAAEVSRRARAKGLPVTHQVLSRKVSEKGLQFWNVVARTPDRVSTRWNEFDQTVKTLTTVRIFVNGTLNAAVLIAVGGYPVLSALAGGVTVAMLSGLFHFHQPELKTWTMYKGFLKIDKRTDSRIWEPFAKNGILETLFLGTIVAATAATAFLTAGLFPPLSAAFVGNVVHQGLVGAGMQFSWDWLNYKYTHAKEKRGPVGDDEASRKARREIANGLYVRSAAISLAAVGLAVPASFGIGAAGTALMALAAVGGAAYLIVNSWDGIKGLWNRILGRKPKESLAVINSCADVF